MNERNQFDQQDRIGYLDLYKLLIDQATHDHTRWADNFGVLCTWNAIVLVLTVSSTMTILGYFGGYLGKPSSFVQSLPASLIPLVLSCIGVALAFITLFVTLRISRSSNDWYKRIRDVEWKLQWPCMSSKIARPFTERRPDFCRGVKGLHLYVIVGLSFIIIYNVVAMALLSTSRSDWLSIVLILFLIFFYNLVVYALLRDLNDASPCPISSILDSCLPRPLKFEQGKPPADTLDHSTDSDTARKS